MDPRCPTDGTRRGEPSRRLPNVNRRKNSGCRERQKTVSSRSVIGKLAVTSAWLLPITWLRHSAYGAIGAQTGKPVGQSIDCDQAINKKSVNKIDTGVPLSIWLHARHVSGRPTRAECRRPPRRKDKQKRPRAARKFGDWRARQDSPPSIPGSYAIHARLSALWISRLQCSPLPGSVYPGTNVARPI